MSSEGLHVPREKLRASITGQAEAAEGKKGRP